MIDILSLYATRNEQSLQLQAVSDVIVRALTTDILCESIRELRIQKFFVEVAADL
jgi:hypothetical protein